jgi:hypothetical protein
LYIASTDTEETSYTGVLSEASNSLCIEPVMCLQMAQKFSMERKSVEQKVESNLAHESVRDVQTETSVLRRSLRGRCSAISNVNERTPPPEPPETEALAGTYVVRYTSPVASRTRKRAIESFTKEPHHEVPKRKISSRQVLS